MSPVAGVAVGGGGEEVQQELLDAVVLEQTKRQPEGRLATGGTVV